MWLIIIIAAVAAATILLVLCLTRASKPEFYRKRKAFALNRVASFKICENSHIKADYLIREHNNYHISCFKQDEKYRILCYIADLSFHEGFWIARKLAMRQPDKWEFSFVREVDLKKELEGKP